MLQDITGVLTIIIKIFKFKRDARRKHTVNFISINFGYDNNFLIFNVVIFNYLNKNILIL